MPKFLINTLHWSDRDQPSSEERKLYRLRLPEQLATELVAPAIARFQRENRMIGGSKNKGSSSAGENQTWRGLDGGE